MPLVTLPFAMERVFVEKTLREGKNKLLPTEEQHARLHVGCGVDSANFSAGAGGSVVPLGRGADVADGQLVGAALAIAFHVLVPAEFALVPIGEDALGKVFPCGLRFRVEVSPGP